MPRRGGGWLSQRDERKCTIVRPLVSSSRAQPSIFLAGGKTVPMRKSVIPSRIKYGVYRSPHFFCLTGVQGRFFASLEMTIQGKAVLSFSALEALFSPSLPYRQYPIHPFGAPSPCGKGFVCRCWFFRVSCIRFGYIGLWLAVLAFCANKNRSAKTGFDMIPLKQTR